MLGLPQELVDVIVDELAKSPKISAYSTVSHQWLDRTQKYHFKSLHFHGQSKLEKWRATINADPLGVSRHVRKLTWSYVNSLEHFDDHIRAFTLAEKAELYKCAIFGSLADLRPLTLLGASLVQLKIEDAETTPSVMASLLAALPHLRRLLVHELRIENDNLPIASPATIPFFEGANYMELTWIHFPPPALHWIPPTARFNCLRIGPLCARNSEIVNEWIASSADCLEHFIIDYFGFRWDFNGFPFEPLDLSRCTSLETLRLPVPLDEPGMFTDIVLPSVPSSGIPEIVLCLEETEADQDDPQAWEAMDTHLCLLAKRFKATNGGGAMTVGVYVDVWEDQELWERIQSEWPMPGLAREANIRFSVRKVVSVSGDSGDTRNPVPHTRWFRSSFVGFFCFLSVSIFFYNILPASIWFYQGHDSS